MIEQQTQRPLLANRMIAREAETSAGLHYACKLIKRVGLHEAALRMPPLGPGVWKQQEHLSDRGRCQGIQQEPSIVRENAGAGTVRHR